MDKLEFYVAAVGVLPLFIITLVIESRVVEEAGRDWAEDEVLSDGLDRLSYTWTRRALITAVVAATVGEFTGFAALYAGGAPWPVDIVIWAAVATVGLLVAFVLYVQIDINLPSLRYRAAGVRPPSASGQSTRVPGARG